MRIRILEYNWNIGLLEVYPFKAGRLHGIRITCSLLSVPSPAEPQPATHEPWYSNRS